MRGRSSRFFKFNLTGVGEFLRSSLFRRWFFYLLMAVVGLSLLSVLVQMFYPRDYSLATVRVGQSNLHWQSRQSIERQIRELESKTGVGLLVDDKPEKLKLMGIGGKFCTNCMVDEALSYSWWERAVPFSLFWKVNDVSQASVEFDSKKLKQSIEPYAEKLNQSPVDAQLAVKGAKAVIEPEKPGKKVEIGEVVDTIVGADYRLGQIEKFTPKGETLKPGVVSKDLESLQKVVNTIINHRFDLIFNETKVEVDPTEVASWIRLTIDDEGRTQYSFDEGSIDRLLDDKFGGKVNKPAGTTSVELLDGVEQSRQEGPRGQRIDSEAAKKEVLSILLDESSSSTVKVMTKEVDPKVVYKDNFTSSQAGLQAYLNSLSRDHDIRVSVAQIGGNGWAGQSRGGELSVAASTYKLFVAQFVLDKISRGEWSMDEAIGGTSTRECLDRMIVKSDNACPLAFLDKFGRANVTNYLWSKGYSQVTTFNSREYSSTSTNDLVRVLQGIDSGSAVAGEGRDFLLGLMARQVFRQGVPAGSSALVQNKVGFLWGYLNDAAIVRHPRGTYAIAVITNNQSWGKIAEITKKIEEIMYP